MFNKKNGKHHYFGRQLKWETLLLWQTVKMGNINTLADSKNGKH